MVFNLNQPQMNVESVLNLEDLPFFCYHPRMRIGNNFSRVCTSVQAMYFELLKVRNFILTYRYILTIFRLSLSIKVIGPRSRSNEKLTYFYLTVTSVGLYSTKTYLKGQGHLKVKVKFTQYQGTKPKWPNGMKHCAYCTDGHGFEPRTSTSVCGHICLSIYNCFCDQCVSWMVYLRLKDILVGTIICNQVFIFLFVDDEHL